MSANRQSTPTGSASAGGSGPAHQPPGIAFMTLMNMLTGQGTSGVRSLTHSSSDIIIAISSAG